MRYLVLINLKNRENKTKTMTKKSSSKITPNSLVLVFFVYYENGRNTNAI